MTNLNEMFGRRVDAYTVAVLYVADGSAVTRIDATIYPVGSGLSARHEHATGIVLHNDDAALIGLEIE